MIHLARTDREHISVPITDLLRGTYILGTPGGGKTSAAKCFISQFVDLGIPFFLLEPEGGLHQHALRELACGFDLRDNPSGVLRTVILEPATSDYAAPLNVFCLPEGLEPYTRVDALLGAFRRFWSDSWGPRVEDALRNLSLLMIEQGMTMYELMLCVSYPQFREKLADRSRDPLIRAYLLEHLGKMRHWEVRSWTEALRNKLSAFVLNPYILPSLIQDKCLDFHFIMEHKKNVLAFPSQEHLKASTDLYGMLLLTLFQEALSRRPENTQAVYALIIDELQLFAAPGLLDIITRARRRGIAPIVMHQSMKQPPFDKDRTYIENVMGLSHIKIVFRCAHDDAATLVKEMFELRGDEVKVRKSHPLWGSHGPATYWSIQEQLEHWTFQLQNQRPRDCFVSVATGELQTWAARTFDVPEEPVHEKQLECFRDMAHWYTGEDKETVKTILEERTAFLHREYGLPAPPPTQVVEEHDPPAEPF